MPGRRGARKLAAGKMREVRADGQVIDELEVKLIAAQCQVVVAEKRDQRFEVVAVGINRIDGDISLVSKVIEEIANFVRHARAPTVNDDTPRRALRLRHSAC